MLALTHLPSPRMDHGLCTFVERTPIDYALALRQHEAYRRMLERCGAAVRALDVHRQLPDCQFIEDAAIVLDEVAVMTTMATTERRAEPAGIEPELRRYRAIERIESPATIEGGDVLRVGRALLVGLSTRTNPEGIRALEAIAARHGYRVTAVPVRGCLHLKSACTALPDGRLLLNPEWIDMRALGGFQWIRVPHEDPGGANVALVGRHVCAAAAHAATVDLIRAQGFDVVSVDLSEFAKLEGCVTCLSILFHEK